MFVQDDTITNDGHDGSLQQFIHKRNTTPNEDRQTTKDISNMIKEEIRKIKNEESMRNIARILSNFRGLRTRHPSNTGRNKVLITDVCRIEAGNNTCDGHFHCGRVRRLLRGAPFVNDEDTRTRTRAQVRVTPTHNEAVHGARTQRPNQPTQKTRKLQTREEATRI